MIREKKYKQTDWPKKMQQLKKAGYSQYRLAEMTGISQGKLSRLANAIDADILHSGGNALIKIWEKRNK